MRKRQPLYRQIYQSLLKDIQKGIYPPGAQIPTENELSERFGVSRITSKRALAQLAQEGVIERIPGRGSFVRQDVSAMSHAYLNGPVPGTKRIGFIAQDLGISYGLGLLAGIEEATRALDMGLMIRRTAGDAAAERRAVDEMMAHQVDGLIVFPVNGEQYNPALLRLHLAGFPVVLVDRYFRGIDIPSVGTENELMAKEAVSFLIDDGHRHIALLSPPPEYTVTIEDRIKGYVAAFTDHHLAIDHTLMLTNLTTALPGLSQEDAYRQDKEKLKAFLQSNPEVSALLAVEYNLARIALGVAEELGRKVPDDLAIICFDAPWTEAEESSFFTHIRQDEWGMGQQAVQLLSRLMNERSDEGRNSTGPTGVASARVVVPARFVVGRSTMKRKERAG